MNNKFKVIKVLIVLVLVLTSTSVIAKDSKQQKAPDHIGNVLVKDEFPETDKVLPVQSEKDIADKKIVIEGSVEKNIDITLNECLKLAMGNSPRINIAINDALASHSRIAQVWSNYFPKLQWESGYTKTQSLQTASMMGSSPKAFNYYVLGQATLSQMLYDFGVTQNMATIKKLDYEAYQTTLTEVINDVICQTKGAYFALLLSLENKRVALDTVKKYEMFYNQAKAFYEIGLNPKIDVTIAEVNLSDAKLKLIQAENNIDLAIAKLNNVMGVPYINKYNINERLEFDPVDLSLEQVIDIAKESRPDLKLAEIRVKEANQGVKLAKKAYFPVLTAQGAYARGGQQLNDTYGYNYGVYLNFPTVNGWLIKNQINEAKSLYDREMATSKLSRNNVYLEVQSSYLALNTKKNQIPVAKLQVKQAKENYDLAFGRYKVGVGNPIELKDAQTAYQLSQLNYYNALFDYNTAKANLEKAIGKNLVGEDSSTIGL